MIAAALLCAVFAAPTLEIALAPDQPVPYVYADEPVILQVKSSEDGQATGSVTITGDDGKAVAIALPGIALRANGAHWQPIEGAPAALGRFTVHVALDTGGAKTEVDLVYCRIRRPGNEAHAPVRATVQSPARDTLNALRGIPLREITVPVTTPDIAAVVAAAAAEGFDVSVALDAAAVGDVPSLTQLAVKLGDTVGAWRVTLPEVGVEALEPLAAALRGVGSRGQLEVVLNAGLSNVDTYLATGLARSAAKVLLPAGERPQFERALLRAAFENAGYEAYRLQTIFGPAGADASNPDPFAAVRAVLAAQSSGGASPEIDAGAVFSNNAFGPGYTLVSAMAHRLNGHDYVGELALAPRAHAAVFRRGGAWISVMWADAADAALPLPVGGATDIGLADANNNALPPPAVDTGVARIPAANAPVYAWGNGGSLLAATARAAAIREADGLVKNKTAQKYLPPEFIELLKPVAAPAFQRVDRVSFFAMLRMFPVLEQKWHDGTLPREAAVPAMAALSRLVRNLCVAEQDSGEPFIELLQDTVARCGDYQSQYLTSTSGSADKHERADWLLAEVARLTAEARALADAGREIEAVGVASLAEWRARSLEFARNALPLGAPEPPRAQPEPAPKPEPKKPAPTAKTPKPAAKKPSAAENKSNSKKK